MKWDSELGVTTQQWTDPFYRAPGSALSLSHVGSYLTTITRFPFLAPLLALGSHVDLLSTSCHGEACSEPAGKPPSRPVPANFWKLGVSLFEIHGKLLVIFHIIANTSLFLKTSVIIAMDTAKNKGIDAKKRKHGGKVLQKSNEAPCDFLGRK